jgi:hypothetical protein
MTLALVVALLLLGTGCGGSDESESGAPAPTPAGLNDLDGVDGFAKAFDRDAGRARLVLLLSPT